MSDDDAIALVFHPGFSTAEQVTEVSGRGVGLDVVRTTVREYDGDIKIQSQLGVGTTFRLQIPIRKAVVVVDGLLLSQSGETFIMPFENVREICELAANEISHIQGSMVAMIRGETFSALQLGTAMGMNSQTTLDEGTIKAVLVRHKEESICLFVDAVLGQRKVVINNLHDILPGSDKISGVAQLGGGRLALVLNAAELIKA